MSALRDRVERAKRTRRAAQKSLALRLAAVCIAAGAIFAAPACQREERKVREQGRWAAPAAGEAVTPPGDYGGNAYAVNEGQRLFRWFNCSGCHANGGGGMGPALMNDKWVYGARPEQIYQSIVQGRPNGMPSFRGKLPEYQVWQLVAYVRSIAGLGPRDALPGRAEHMQSSPSGVNIR
jgi:cytochrome c oxidase cbb3-type subunit 3